MRAAGTRPGSVTGGRPAVADAARGRGQEAPAVAARSEGQGENAECGGADLAVSPDSHEAVMVDPAAADRELTDAPAGGGVAPDVLGGEALIDVGVAVEDHVDAVVVEGGPQGVGATGQEVAGRREPRVVEVGQRAVAAT